MLQWGVDADNPRARVPLAEDLVRNGQPERALAVLDELEKPLQGELSYELAHLELMLRVGREVPQASLVRLYRAGPLLPEVRRILARAAAQRGLTVEALAHMEYLPRLGPLTAEDQTLVRTLRQKLAGGAAP